MSALATPYGRAADGGRRTSLFGLVSSMLAGGFTTGVLFWVVGMPLGMLAVVPLDGQPYRPPWLPWEVHGVWALVAAVAWGAITCWLTAILVIEAMTRRRIERPATEWVTLAVAVSGYLPLAFGSTHAAQVIYAVALGAIMLRLLAFDTVGRARPWRWQPSRRARATTAAGAVLVALSYSVTHALVADGSGGTFSGSTVALRVGRPQTLAVGLSGMRLPITVKSVAITGPGSANARVNAIVLNLDMPNYLTPLSAFRRFPELHRAGLITSATQLPFRVPASRSLWISARVSLRDCQTATVDTLKLRYTVLGVSTSASIPLSGPLTLICSR